MFDLHAVAVSPVVRLGDPEAPPHTAAGRRLAAAAALPPGPEQIALLAPIEPECLDDVERVQFLQTWERASRWVAAQQTSAIVAVAGPEPSGRDDFAREHVRVALLDVGGSARSHVDLARALTGPLIEAHRALERGEISYDHVRVLAQETRDLDEPTRRTVADQTLGVAANTTPAEFRRRVRRAVIKADPIRAELAAARAAERRHVTKTAEPDAQASLDIYGPATDVQTIWTALDLRAAHTSATDERTLDQRRFDALVDICRETSPDSTAATRRGLRPAVYVYADAPTWAGLADEPVELDGYGPIPAGVARTCFTDSTWRAVVTDTITGKVDVVSDSSYTPSARTNRHLHVQDRRCGFPGCHAAVWFCDADHNQPYDSGGCTNSDNCGLLCRRHHRLKTFTRWRWNRLPDGSLEWTDPYGCRWTREPITYDLPPPTDPPDDQNARPAAVGGKGSPGAKPSVTTAAQPPPLADDPDVPPF